MDQSRFDQLTRGLAASSSRRRLARWGGGGLAAMAAVALAPAADGAARRQPVRCKTGKLVGRVVVLANGTQEQTPKLERGQDYTLLARGAAAASSTHDMDAVAFYPGSNHEDFSLTYQGVRVGLSVDNRSPDRWGSYRTTHNYFMGMRGKGRRLPLRTTDPISADNHGALTVDVYCGKPEDVVV